MNSKYEIINYKIIGFERIHNAKPKNILELYINYAYRLFGNKGSIINTYLTFEFDDKENLYKLKSINHSQILLIFLVNNNILKITSHDNYYLNKSVLLGLI